MMLVGYLLTGCNEDPGEPILTADKQTVAVGEEVTLTLGGLEKHTCIRWIKEAGADYEILAGGNIDDLTMTVKFLESDTGNILVNVKNCRGEDDPCSGTCRDAYASINIEVE